MLDDLPDLDGDVYAIHGDFEQSEVSSIFVDLGEVSSRLVDNYDCLTWNLLRGTKLRFLFLRFAPCLGERSVGLR